MEEIEVPVEPVAQFALNYALESDELEIIGSSEGEDEFKDSVTMNDLPRNVSGYELLDENTIFLTGEIEYQTMVDYHRATFHHPAEAEYAEAIAHFGIGFRFEDLGEAWVEIHLRE